MLDWKQNWFWAGCRSLLGICLLPTSECELTAQWLIEQILLACRDSASTSATRTSIWEERQQEGRTWAPQQRLPTVLCVPSICCFHQYIWETPWFMTSFIQPLSKLHETLPHWNMVFTETQVCVLKPVTQTGRGKSSLIPYEPSVLHQQLLKTYQLSSMNYYGLDPGPGKQF